MRSLLRFFLTIIYWILELLNLMSNKRMNKEIEANQEEIRKRIRSIQSDKTLSSEDKAKQCQELLKNQQTNLSSSVSSSNSSFSLGSKNNEATSCEHYPQKQCSSFFFDCCQVIDPCHRCHYARTDLQCTTKPPQISSILCNQCQTRQEPSKQCISCQIDFSHSYCTICKIWTAVDIVHCEFCGFCRVGKEGELFHCHQCDACYGITSKDNHKCSKLKLRDAICAYCLDNLYTSQFPSTLLPCKHFIHEKCCTTALQKNEYRCPTCRKSMVNMKSIWNEIRQSIIVQPLPLSLIKIHIGEIVSTSYGNFKVISFTQSERNDAEEDEDQDEVGNLIMCQGELVDWILANGKPAKASINIDELKKQVMIKNILCYDCEKKSKSLFHFLGLECKFCGSFNTCQI
jgi:RING finger/CHY zinc finger protein 1